MYPSKKLVRLYERMKMDDKTLPKWDSLPIYSRQAITNTDEIWSWDGHYMIIGTCSDDIRIVCRNDL